MLRLSGRWNSLCVIWVILGDGSGSLCPCSRAAVCSRVLWPAGCPQALWWGGALMALALCPPAVGECAARALAKCWGVRGCSEPFGAAVVLGWETGS